MNTFVIRITLGLALACGIAACDDDATDLDTFNLTFAGDDSFHGAHGGQDIAVALVRSDDGAVLETRTGTVSATADPAFSFDFGNVLEDGEDYEVHYWIDSNFGQGATAEACDPPANDHQWNIDLGTANADIDHVETHQPANTTSVCATFD